MRRMKTTIAVKKVSEPSKNRGRRLVSEYFEIEGTPPHIHKLKKVGER